MFRKILFIVGGLLFVAVLAAAVGLGIWAYGLNSQLAQAQADHQALQGDYDALAAEYSQAKEEFKVKSSQAASDLDEANAQVTRLQGDVEKLQDENSKLRTKLEKIQNRVAMLSDFWFMSDSVFERKVDASSDEQLKELYANLQESQRWEDLVDLMSYMIQSIAEVSEVSWQPVTEVNAFVEVGANR